MIRVILLIVAVFLVGCIERFRPNIEFEMDQIVIEGHIANNNEKQTIRISYSVDMRNPVFRPVQNCEVSVSDNKGNAYFFEEEDPGTYGFMFHPDDLDDYLKYKLQVVLPNGEIYVSEEETLFKADKIDSLFYAKREQVILDPNDDGGGVQVYLNYDKETMSPGFFKYEIEETWEFYTPMEVEFMFDDLGFRPAPGESKRNRHCWKTASLKDIYLLSTSGLKDSVITSYPLHFISYVTEKVKHKYSAHVTQLKISEEAYYYFEKLEKQSLGASSLYDVQPFPLVGNIYNMNNPEERAFGYFYVGSSSSRRMFIKDSNYKDEADPSCTLLTIFSFAYFDPADYPIYIKRLDPPVPDATWGWARRGCFDCVEAGGYLTKPDYWDE